MNLHTTFILLVSALLVSCVQTDKEAGVDSSSAGNPSTSKSKNKVFKARQASGHFNLIARSDINLGDIEDKYAGFERITISVNGESVSMSSTEFNDRNGLINLPLPRYGELYLVTFHYADGSSKSTSF